MEAATGWWPRTAVSSPMATLPLKDHRANCTLRILSLACSPRPTAAATGSSGPTEASSLTATLSTSARWRASGPPRSSAWADATRRGVCSSLRCRFLEGPAEERLHLGPVHRAPHRRQPLEQHAAIGRRRQPRVEHRDHALVLCRADEPPGALGQQRGGPRQVDEREGAGAGPVAPRLEQRVVGPRERQAVDRDERESPTGDVD